MKIKNIVFVSDTHFGCRFGLCPDKVDLDGGGQYISSRFQKEVWKCWLEFWNVFVPQVTKGEDYVIVFNGDLIDGVHHNSTTQISHNMTDQKNLAVSVLSVIVTNKKCKDFFVIRGTEVHVGKSGCDEESIARELKKIKFGKEIKSDCSTYDLWLEFGDAKSLCHFTHHVGTTNSAAYESTAVYKELVEAYNEAGRWKSRPPDLIARSHRHRDFEIKVPSDNGQSIAICSPGWQLKTPHVYRGSMGRSGSPHIGGIVIREGDEDSLFCRHYVKKVSKPKIVTI